MKAWNVRVSRPGGARHIGQVMADREEWARCAALSRYGVTDEEIEAGEVADQERAILPDDDFDVSPA
ncbi:MAG: hypothetical protein K6U78_04055 [Anaerolineae bacterium]|nr:hypothetical protein [Anaerolineae bacterium]